MDAGAAYAKTGPDAVQTNASNIWQTMVQTVRRSDTQKVDDTKEDIGTLLVFAGLFSAVVTTFLVATYPSLQPDDTSEMVFLLRQSLAQNYTYVDGVLRPMAPFPPDPPFEIPLWAFRVNALWFASLIVSLSTASFGMLVKQWLIEYVAMEQWISPEEQLRARQYRLPGLRHWRVFEIAALLPLLLHISLGLFFVGLSFYTAAANATIGRATFTLVAGWAFFALLTLVAPLASPRCPYKVTLFKAALRIGRRYVTSHFWRPGRAALNGTAHAARWVWVNVVCLPYRLGSAFMRGLTSMLASARQVSKYLWLPLCTALLPFLLVGGALSYLKRFVVYIVSDHETDTIEEEDEMHRPYERHKLLLSVDELIINDGPVLSTMAELLRHTRTEPQFVMAFVLGCIRHRIAAANRDKWIPVIDEPVRGLLDLQILSESAWEVLAKLMGETLKPKMSESAIIPLVVSDGDSPWLTNATVVLLSRSQWPFPEPVHQLLKDEANLAKMLQLIRKSIDGWPVRDVLHVVWVATTVFDRKPGAVARSFEKKWARLPARDKQDRTLTHLQIAVVQMILEHAWREKEEKNDHSIEAIPMVARILGTSLPVPDVREHQMQLSQSSASGADMEDGISTYPAFPTEYSDIADYLSIIVETSGRLVESALRLYSAYFHRTLAPHRHESLWTGIYRAESDELLSADMKPVILDLWRFLLGCARNGGEHLQTDEFIKLCLALARPNFPRDLGRSHPDDDWKELVPILERAADTSKDAPLSSMDRDENTVSALADHALEQLRLSNSKAPEHLIRVLERLVETAAKPPSGSDDQDEGFLRYGMRLMFRRGRDSSADPHARGFTLSPSVRSPRNDGSPAPPSDHAASPTHTSYPRQESRALSAIGEEKDSAYADRPRGRSLSARGFMREKSPRQSTATVARSRDLTPQFSRERQVERAHRSRTRSQTPPITIESSRPSSHDVARTARRDAGNIVKQLPSRSTALSFSSRQSLTAASTRLSVQAPAIPTRTLPVQATVPAPASTSTSVGTLSRAGNINVPPPTLFLPTLPFASNVPAPVSSSARTVPAISIRSASSAARPMPAAGDSSVSSSILLVPTPRERPTPQAIGAHRALPPSQAPAAVYSTSAQRLPSTRTSSALPSVTPSRLGGIAVGGSSGDTNQHAGGSAHAALLTTRAGSVVREVPRSDSASFASRSMRMPWSAESHESMERQHGRSQSVDLEAGPVDVPQHAHPRRSRSTSQAPSLYSFTRADP